MAISALFSPGTGLLSVYGDDLNNSIEISRDAAGTLRINGGAVAVRGGTATVANTGQISVFGQGGDDVITLNEANGALPAASLYGGAGNDVLTGGSGADLLFGQAGNDQLFGKGGSDALFGGAGNDVLVGGDGADQLYGEGGDDRLVWNPGDDSDLMEGGNGTDTVEVNGGNGAEVFTATANGTRVRFDRLDPAPFALDIGTAEKLVVNMNGGDDRFSATGNLAALIGVSVDGGTGNDTILGGNGADLLLGGDGNDFVDGQQGNDSVFLGAGDDLSQWDPGDGSDTVEGGAGSDALLFNGSAIGEAIALEANGGRVRMTRNIGTVTMDLNDLERVQIAALGGTDTVEVGDLSGTDVTQIDVALAGTLGGSAGDAAADTVIATGTQGGDVVDVFGSGTSVAVVGLAAQVNVTGAEGANDALVVRTLGGDDAISATTLPADVVKLTIDAGAGNDTVFGSQGADVLIGGDGNDFLFGDGGNDVAFMGAGNDVFQWNPGDGSDTVEGQDGSDTLQFFGANIAETIAVAANGGRALFTRDISGIAMDLNDVERIDFRALAGADAIVVGDLSGTDVTQVDIDLRGPNGGGDGEVDVVTVNATQGVDAIAVTGGAGGVQVSGLAAKTSVFFAETGDRLALNGQGGDDSIDAGALQAGGPALTINGGLGNDVMIGGQGDDLVLGGDGNDTALMGAGDDTFVWNPGDDNDTVEGQAGFDTLQFNGANIAETIQISANGGRALFTRDIAGIAMDLNDVEAIDFRALGGADLVTVNDLSGTDVSSVRIDLGASGGAGDLQADTVVIRGTQGDDIIQVFSSGTSLFVVGLAAQIEIDNFEAGLDRLVIEAQGGADVVDGYGVAAPFGFTADGGEGDDVLLGGDGNDVLLGGAGDDVLLGGDGIDVVDGGVGDDIEIQALAPQATLI